MVSMKHIFLIFILFAVSFTAAANNKVLRNDGLNAFHAKSYSKAVLNFYQWSKLAKSANEKQESKFYLGIALAKLNLLQVASFPLIDVVRLGEGQYRKKALNQLALYATQLDEKGLLKYTLLKLNPEELTEVSKSVFFLNLSEIAEEQNQFDKALTFAKQSLAANDRNDEALYQLGSLSLEKLQFQESLAYFSQLLEKYKDRSPADKKRALLTLNIARVYYQMKDWTKAADYYRQIPKDYVDYRVALQELSWALLRGGQLRSALSPLQSLLSPFYAQFFDPETLLISSSIYIFSCQYQDSFDATESFEKNYLPTLSQLETWLKGQRTPDDFYAELVRAQRALDNLTKTGEIEAQSQLPFYVFRSVIAESNIQGGLKYLKRLEAEQKKLKQEFTASPFLIYGNKILKGRMIAAKKQLASDVERYLKSYAEKTAEMASQIGFIKYEALNGLRIQLKEKYYRPEQVIDNDITREYYAQNGYRYWPFEGEFWRDEIGSFQYVGINRCQK